MYLVYHEGHKKVEDTSLHLGSLDSHCQNLSYSLKILLDRMRPRVNSKYSVNRDWRSYQSREGDERESSSRVMSSVLAGEMRGIECRGLD